MQCSAQRRHQWLYMQRYVLGKTTLMTCIFAAIGWYTLCSA